MYNLGLFLKHFQYVVYFLVFLLSIFLSSICIFPLSCLQSFFHTSFLHGSCFLFTIISGVFSIDLFLLFLTRYILNFLFTHFFSSFFVHPLLSIPQCTQFYFLFYFIRYNLLLYCP
uniref:Uncharacterized protein n=1 Tax=Cacopsylla melanoneura TaxID=428564 RepID=A0A8D9BWV8_9HEMI